MSTSCATRRCGQIEFGQVHQEVRSSLSGDLYSQVDTLVSTQDRLDEVESALKPIDDNRCYRWSPLQLEIDLLSGYENLTCFIGTVRDAKAVEVPKGGLMFTGSAGQTVIGVFVLNADAAAAQATLEVTDYPNPDSEYEGSLVMRMVKSMLRRMIYSPSRNH